MITVVSYGGGTNSTALLVGLHERQSRPDYILFADTGGEFQRTYDHVQAVNAWCESVGFPSITVVSNADPENKRHGHKSLEDECLRNGTLPSLAYGFKGCSAKWKRQPMDRFLRDQPDVKAAWENGEKVLRYIGIDAGEAHRSAALVEADDPKWHYERPLIDWDWARDECIEAIERAGLPLPGKSACYFCPAARKHEVIDLADKHPDLFQRAVAIEENAAKYNQSTEGLGRNYSWANLVKADRAQLKLFSEATEVACMCFDGDAD